MNAGEPEYLKHLSTEEVADTAHAIITGKNSQIHALRQSIHALEKERDGYKQFTESYQRRIADLEARPCPHVVSSDEGTQYCGLAEGRVSELESRAGSAEAAAKQWQESSGQNYVRAQDAEAREERLREAIETHRADVQCDGSHPYDTTAADVALWKALETKT